MKLKFVPNARKAWKWFSVQAMTISMVSSTAWLALPDELRDAIPQEWMAIGAAALMFLGIVGRLIDQGDSE